MGKTMQEWMAGFIDQFDVIDKRLAESERIIKAIAEDVSALKEAPAPRRGVKVPPTALPEMLDELEIGKHPKGT